MADPPTGHSIFMGGPDDPGFSVAPPGERSIKGSTFEVVHGTRKMRFYLVSAHELASISVMSGSATFLLTLGIFLLGVAVTAFYGVTTSISGITIAISAVLGGIFVVAAVVLLLVRHADVARIKKETSFGPS